MRDRIRVLGLEIECVVGVLPDERVSPQPLRIDVALGLDLDLAGRTGRIADTLDYTRVVIAVEALLRFRRYRLLEMAAHELAAMLLGLAEGVHEVELALEKPRALGPRARGAAVSIRRRRSDFPRRRELTRFGAAEILAETREAGLYLLHVEPGKEIPSHYHRVMHELEWLVHGNLWRADEELQPFRPVTWEHGIVHEYRNRGASTATLFCCDRPPFSAEDEIEVR